MANKGKHAKRKSKRNNRKLVICIAVLGVLLAALIWIAVRLHENSIPILDNGNQTEPSGSQTESANNPTQTPTEPALIQFNEIKLDDGIVIEAMTNYAGVYMEDGSDRVVTSVMMLLVENTNASDLQLARIQVEYEDFTAEFEVTNLPAGEKVVLLEKNGMEMPAGDYQSVAMKNVVFFQEPMSLQSDKLEITEGNGYLDIKNISGTDITGTVRVFYKNSAMDLLYGGITYVATLHEGVAAGETMRVMTGHFAKGNSRIVNVDCGA